MSIAERARETWTGLLAGEKLATELVHQLVVPTFVLDAQGHVIVWNQACERLTGVPAELVLGTTDHWRAFYSEPRPCLADLVLLGERGEISRHYELAVCTKGADRTAHAETWCRMPSRGIELYLALDVGVIRDDDGSVIGVVETLRDLTDRNIAETQLQLVASVFEHSQEGIIITDPEARILDVNRAFVRTTGYSRLEVLGKTPAVLKSGLQNGSFYRDMWRLLRQDGHWEGEIWNRKKGGEIYPEMLHINAVRDERGEVSHYIGLFVDITDLKSTQQRLLSLAHYDALTDLPNRVLLALRLHHAMAQAKRQGHLVAICSLDLDDFKLVNDAFGHAMGDRLLVQVAERLRTALRAEDTVARLGGDEFVLLIAGLMGAEELDEILTRLFEQVAKPYQVERAQISVSASIGVTLYPPDGSDADTLLRHANLSMYQAKQLGRNRYQLFDLQAARDLRARHLELERVRSALQHGELRLHYQPKVNMKRGQVVGLEALIRWQRDDGALLAPADFLPLVEQSPLIVELGEWVLHEALAQMTRWRQDGLDLCIGVNIAARHFQHIDFLPRLERILAEYPAVPAKCLELEILESVALEDIKRMRELIVACQRMGVTFALDDFGTGYSSLSYLKQLPAETLKIDRSFVRDMLDDQDDLALVDGVIGLANAFGKQVIAEGVETPEHGLLLMRHGCDCAQGFGIARPMPADAVSAWIQGFRQDWRWRAYAHGGCRREDLPLLLAGYDYRRWLDRLLEECDRSAGLDASALSEPFPSARLAGWLTGPARLEYDRSAELAALEHAQARVLSVLTARDRLGARGDGETSAQLRALVEAALQALSDLQRMALGNDQDT